MFEFIESILSKEVLFLVKNFKNGIYGPQINYGVIAVEKNGNYIDGVDEAESSIKFIDAIKALVDNGANPFYINPENKKLLIDELLQDFVNISNDYMEKIREIFIGKITEKELKNLHPTFNNELLLTVIYGKEKYKKEFFNKGLKYKQNIELSEEPIEIDLIKYANFDFLQKVLELDEKAIDFNKKYKEYGEEKFSLKELINNLVENIKKQIELNENQILSAISEKEKSKANSNILLLKDDLEKFQEQLDFFNKYILKNELADELKTNKYSNKVKI